MRPHPRRAATDPTAPRAWGTSDRNGMIGNLENMQWQWDWAGTQLVNKGLVVHADELDEPQRQLGTVLIPPDPVPIMNARPEAYAIDEYPVSTLSATDGRILVVAYKPYPIQIIVAVPGNLTTS